MPTAILTTKGQVVIPSEIRKRLKIKTGTRLHVTEEGGRIILRPLDEEYFEKMAGILKTRGKLTRELLRERKKDKETEDRK